MKAYIIIMGKILYNYVLYEKWLILDISILYKLCAICQEHKIIGTIVTHSQNMHSFASKQHIMWINKIFIRHLNCLNDRYTWKCLQ
jgi:hypothetical protein